MARKKKIVEEINVIPQQILQKPIGEVSRDCFLDFGNYINNQRHTAGFDGCKPSYRRLIFASLQFPKGKLIPSTTVISSVANYHPHSLTGIELLNSNLVHTGVFSGEGSWGYTEISGVYSPYAAPRYTKQRISDTYLNVFGDLWREVPMIESPIAGSMEISYLPLPLPLCLYMKSSVTGLGIGIKSDYPNFSPVSLYKAYINNDPSLLEPNANLFIDKSKSELDKLWKTGKGKITYSFKLERAVDNMGNPGVLFKGDTFLFTPNLRKFRQLAAEGKVYMEDITDIYGPKLIISKIPGARGITIEEIEDLASKCCFDSSTYTTNVTTGSTTFRIPLYDWLNYTYKNYIDLITKVNIKKIDKVTFDISVLEVLPIISDYIINKNPKATDEELSKVLNIPMEIINSVMSKPISYLRKNKDTSSRIKELKEKLKELKKFDPIKYTENIINQL